MRKTLVFGLLLGMILTCIGCGGNDDANTVNVAYFPNMTHGQALVMKNQGSLEKQLGEEYAVNWISFNAGPAEVEAMFAGEVDLGYIGPVPAINAYVQSEGDVNIIAGATNGGAVLVASNSATVHSVADLDGLTVAIPQLGNTQHLLLLHLLSEVGLAPTDSGGTVEVLKVENADVSNMMDQGEIDAALVPEPWGTILTSEGKAQLAMDYNELWQNGDYSTAVVIVNGDFKAAHPEVVGAFLALHKEATVYINENPDAAKSLINTEIEAVTSEAIPQEVLGGAFERIIFSAEIPEESIFEFGDLYYEEGFSENKPDEGLIDDSFMK